MTNPQPNEPPAPPVFPPEPTGQTPAASQSALILQVSQDADLFQTPEGKPYATVKLKGRSETYAVRSTQFRNFLNHQCYRQSGKSAGSQALLDAISTLEGKAMFDGVSREVYCRVAPHDGNIYLDLANENRDIVVVSADGWRIERDVAVRFRRPKGMLGLPAPVRGGHLVADLEPFVNADPNDLVLIVSWLLGTMQPGGAYPVLQIKGEQGSAKSTVSKLLRKIIDPNTAPARARPKDERDLAISLTNSHLGCFDNLSDMPDWFSDALCRVSTGQAFATRTLQTDEDESIFAVKRPVVLNGIENVATRGDLIDRSIMINLPRITPEKRITEMEFWSRFDNEHPRILGGLLDASVAALARLGDVHTAALPRMSDFARWIIAAEPYMCWPAGTFLRAYNENKVQAGFGVIEASPVASALLRFVSSEWKGSATALLSELEAIATDLEKRQANWPKSPHAMGGAISRLAPTLRDAGIQVSQGKSGQRFIHFTRIAPESGTPNPG